MKPLLGLAAICGVCALGLIVIGDYEGALLGAIGGAVLYVAHEVIRIRTTPDEEV